MVGLSILVQAILVNFQIAALRLSGEYLEGDLEIFGTNRKILVANFQAFLVILILYQLLRLCGRVGLHISGLVFSSRE